MTPPSRVPSSAEGRRPAAAGSVRPHHARQTRGPRLAQRRVRGPAEALQQPRPAVEETTEEGETSGNYLQFRHRSFSVIPHPFEKPVKTHFM